jgi:ribosomal protein S1
MSGGADDDEWARMRDRSRPTDEQWSEISRMFTPGALVSGVVLSHHPFGFFVDLGGAATGLVEIPRALNRDEPVSPSDYPPVGVTITAVVLGGNDLQRQIHLSTAPQDLTRRAKA